MVFNVGTIYMLAKLYAIISKCVYLFIYVVHRETLVLCSIPFVIAFQSTAEGEQSALFKKMTSGDSCRLQIKHLSIKHGCNIFHHISNGARCVFNKSVSI